LRGRRSPIDRSYRCSHRPAPRASPTVQRFTTARCNTRSADTNREPGASNLFSNAVEIPYGGLETTRNGLDGNRRSAASARTTVTGSSANRRRNLSARPGWSSTATTWAPARTSGAVSAPSPAPTSRTSSPGTTPAASTTRCAQRLSSGCHPQAPRACPEPGTTDHHKEVHDHAPTLEAQRPWLQRVFMALVWAGGDEVVQGKLERRGHGGDGEERRGRDPAGLDLARVSTETPQRAAMSTMDRLPRAARSN
jgi:hypothetical protein